MFRTLSAQVHDFSLRPRRCARLFLAAVAALGLGGAIETARIAIAGTLGESTSRRDLRRAVALDSANPEFQHALGLACFEAPDVCGPTAALHHLQRATELNPNKPIYWSDLAAACEARSNEPCAEAGFDRAIGLSPMTPRFYWLAANYDLRHRRSEAAMSRLRRLLELDPEYAPEAFEVSLRLLDDPQLVFRNVVPAADPALKLAYVNFLSAQGRGDAAGEAWKETVATSSGIHFPDARPYLDRLISTGQYEAAASVWQGLEHAGAITPPAAGSHVFNGGFEHAPLDAGFDWRYEPEPYLAADFADPQAHEGKRCLRLDFTAASNTEFEPVSQLIPLAPHARYLLTAYVRSQDITSDSGPRLRLIDPKCAACLDASTVPVLGTTPWHPVSLDFTTASQTQVVKLSVWRPRSRSFPPEITGHFWLDSVCLAPPGATAPVPARDSVQ